MITTTKSVRMMVNHPGWSGPIDAVIEQAIDRALEEDRRAAEAEAATPKEQSAAARAAELRQAFATACRREGATSVTWERNGAFFWVRGPHAQIRSRVWFWLVREYVPADGRRFTPREAGSLCGASAEAVRQAIRASRRAVA